MKKILLVALCAVLALTVSAQNGKKKKKKNEPEVVAAAPTQLPTLATDKDSASYAYGIVLGGSLKRQLNNDLLNRDLVVKAIMASIQGDTLAFSGEDASLIYNNYNRNASAKLHEVTRKAGEDFLEKNGKRPEVKTTTSGLQYEVLNQASPDAAMPKATDRVKVHYTGMLIDGSIFDSSVQRGQPAEFGLNQVIKGWTEGVQLMHVGEKFKFYIPYKLGYGERGSEPRIKPYSALIFEVELLSITPAK
jgi:FKBP-type peptidyl-prolyl cis-trans isomerase FklB